MFYFSVTQKLVVVVPYRSSIMESASAISLISMTSSKALYGWWVAHRKKIGEDGLPLPPYSVYNIGGGTPENLLDYIRTLQEELVRAGVLPEEYDFESHRELVGMQLGDVPVSYADSSALEADYGFKPSIGVREGLRGFAEWYKGYYGAR